MIQGSIITGRILDAFGQSMPDVSVEAFAVAYHSGILVLQPVTAKMTDDRGEYRLFWVPPGEYYVGVTPRAPTRTARGPQAVETFYPGVTNITGVMPIVVHSGEEISGIDIGVRTERLARISGQVTSTVVPPPAPPDAQGAFAIIAQAQNRSADLILISHDVAGPDITDPRSVATVALNSGTGQFDVANVRPGSYDLYALVNDRNEAFAAGRASLEIRDQDVSGIRIAIHSGVDVRGMITVNGNAPPKGEMRVSLRPDGTLTKLGYAPRSVLVDANGAFRIAAVPEGRFRVMMEQAPTGLYVDEVRQNNLSVYDSGFDVGADSPMPIQVMMKSGATTVEGKANVPGATIALIPTTRRQNFALYNGTIADPLGNFMIRGVAPGEYKLFAWDNAPPGAYYNSAFLARYDERGQPVHVLADSKIATEVAIIRDEGK